MLFWVEGLRVKRARQRRRNRMERRVRWGAGAGQGVASRWGDKGTPCPGSQRSGWPTGRLANWLVNVQMNAAVLSHSSPEPCLAFSSCWLSSARRRGFLPATDTQGTLEKGRLVGGGRLDVNSPTHKNIWGGVNKYTPTQGFGA